MINGYYDSDTLIDAVKRKASVPASQTLMKDQDILNFATEELLLGILPQVITNHQGYYLYSEDVVVTKDEIEIPYRALGNKIEDVAVIESDGQTRELYRITLQDLHTTPSSNSRYFYLMADKLKFHGQRPSGKIRFYYSLKPNSLVPTKNVGIIKNITTTPTDITLLLDKAPVGFGTSLVPATSLLYDLIKSKSPHQVISFDHTITVYDSNSQTITMPYTDVIANVKVGDRIALSGQTDLINCPSELHPVLAQRTVTRVLEALGDSQGLTNANQKLMEMEKKSNDLVQNRVTYAPVKLRPSPLLNYRRSGNRTFRSVT